MRWPLGTGHKSVSGNGSGGNGAELEMLEATFEGCGYVFRHYEDCQPNFMRWQCGRNVADTVVLPDGSGLLIERFELLAWSHSMEGLIEKLA